MWWQSLPAFLVPAPRLTVRVKVASFIRILGVQETRRERSPQVRRAGDWNLEPGWEYPVAICPSLIAVWIEAPGSS